MALKNFTQFTPYTTLSGTDYFVGYRDLDEIRTDFESLTIAVSGILLQKGFTPGASVGQVRWIRYRYTIASGNNLNAVSGTDDYGLVLSYSPGQIEVFRNGAHLVESLDFVANNNTQIRNLSTLSVGDIVEVLSLSSSPLTIFNPITGLILNTSGTYRYTVAAGNTIVPGATQISGLDDFGSTLNFVSPNLDVYLNGMHLVRDSDYTNYSNGNSLTLGLPVADGDTVDVVSLSATSLSRIVGIDGYNGVTRILAGDKVTISPDSGTGIVTISSYTSLDDIQVPTWTDGGHVTGWATVQQYLSAVARTNVNPLSVAYVEFFGSLPGGNAHSGGVLAPNGKIYWAPHLSSLGRIVDPSNNSIATYGTFPVTGVGMWTGAVLAPSGKIYLVPMAATYGVVIDPSNNTLTSYGTFTGGVAHDGGVLAPNGKIYFIPHTTSIGRLVDPANNTITTYIGFPVVAGGYIGGVLAPNGKIYFCPCNATVGVLLDPTNNTVTTYGSFPGSSAYVNGTLAPNGNIYLAPHNATVGRFIDTTNNTVTTYGSFPGSGAYSGAVLASNGCIYFGPHNATIGRSVDPYNNNLVVTYGSFPGSGAYSDSGVLAPNGKIYFVPYGATSGVAISILPNNIFNNNICTNPFFNK